MMLRLDDRLQTAIFHGAGVNLTPQEVVQVAGWLVFLRTLATGQTANSAPALARRVLGELVE